MSSTAGEQLKAELKRQGRSMVWLAEATGYSYSHVQKAIYDQTRWTEDFQAAVAAALGVELVQAELYKGRAIKLPVNVIKGMATLPKETRAKTYEDAWKESWLKEHAEVVLAVAAERAWQDALATAPLRPAVKVLEVAS